MPHGFDVYRVFISAPGDLESDREACRDAISRVNESTAMPEKILLASIGLRDSGQIETHRAVVSDNVRWSTYFIQIFQDDWGPRDLFRKLFLLAVDCRDDAAMPMREVAICLKEAPRETDLEILKFRKELEEYKGVRICRYTTPDELKAQLEATIAEWAQSLISLKDSATPMAAS